jgi:putative SOS response-associated peptidase YedK
MVYYSSIKSDIRDMVREFDVVFPDAELFKSVYSAFTFLRMPVISSNTPKQILFFQWGLVPFRVKNIDQANSIRQQTLNARSETKFVKPAFRQAIKLKRCLVIVDGFFECCHVEKKTVIELFEYKELPALY